MITFVLQQISIWIVVIPFLIGLMNYNGLNRDSKWILLLVTVALPPQIITAIVDKETPLLSLSYNLYTPIEVAILYIIFLSKFTGNINRNIVHVSAWLFLVFYGFTLAWLGLQSKFLNQLVCAANVMYMVWIFLLLKQEYNAPETLIVRENPFTWYFIAIVLYAPGRVVTMALYYNIRDPHNPALQSLSIIDSLFNILLYVFFSAGLWIRRNGLNISLS